MPSQRRIPICLLLAVAAVLLCAAPSLADGPGARAWLTTGDRSSLLAEQPPAALGAPDPAAPTISVDPSRSYQRIEGLGGSITDSSARLLARSPDRDAIMRSLFHPRDGLGLSYLRQPMGASDFVAGPALHLRRRARRADRLPPRAPRSPTTAPRSCRCCARRCD